MFVKTRQFFRVSWKNQELSQICAILVVSFCGITTTGLMSWPSPSIPILTSNLTNIDAITFEEASYFSVIPPIATVIVSPIAGKFVDIIGRKKIILLIPIPQIISWSIIATANNLIHLYISRVFFGISDALIFSSVSIYIAEISTPKIRAMWANTFMVFSLLGQLLINLIGSYCSIKTTALIFLIFPIIQFILILLLPESPYYYLMKKQNFEAEQSLKWLRRNPNIQDEFDQLVKDVERQVSESGTIKDLFLNPTNRKILIVCIATRAFQQFGGISAFAVYNTKIFEISAGNLSSNSSTLVYTGTLFVVSAAYLFVVGKYGRRCLFLISSSGTTVTLFTESVYFYLQSEIGIDISRVSWIPLITMILYIFAFTLGLGLLPTAIIGELFSANIKGSAIAVTNFVGFTSIIVSSKLFQYLTVRFGMYLPFLVFAVCTLISIPFYYFFMPETKGKTLEEIQQSLKNKKRNSNNL